jgi:hypothetical protein
MLLRHIYKIILLEFVMARTNDSKPNLERMLYYEDIKVRSKRRW